MLSTVKKVGPVLNLFTPQRPEWRMSDIARALEIPKSSAHSLVLTLADVGLLSLGSNGRYRLGWNLLSLSERMRASLNYSEVAVPAMRELSLELHETVLLAALDRTDVVYVERAEGNHPMVRLAGVRPGARVPAHCVAVGKVLLAYRDRAEARAIMANSTWQAFTPTTITTMAALEAELTKVRTDGVAYDRGEVVTDVRCAAAPLLDRQRSVVAAISVSMPAYRFPPNPAKLVARLKATAQVISENLATAEEEHAGAEDDFALEHPGLAIVD